MGSTVGSVAGSFNEFIKLQEGYPVCLHVCVQLLPSVSVYLVGISETIPISQPNVASHPGGGAWAFTVWCI